MDIDSHLWRQADEYWSSNYDDDDEYWQEDIEPGCPECEDSGYIYGQYGELICCDCGAIPYWEQEGGYSFTPLPGTPDYPDDIPF